MCSYFKITISCFLLFSSFHLFSLEERQNISSCENLNIQLPDQNIAIEVYVESFLKRINQCLSDKENKLEIMYALYIQLIEQLHSRKPDNRVIILNTIVESLLKNIPPPPLEEVKDFENQIQSLTLDNLYEFSVNNDIDIQLSEHDRIFGYSDSVFSHKKENQIFDGYEVVLAQTTSHPVHFSILFCQNTSAVKKIIDPLSALIKKIADQFMTSHQFYDPSLFEAIQTLNQSNTSSNVKIPYHPFSYSTEEIHSYLKSLEQLHTNKDLINHFLKPLFELAEINNKILDKKLEYCTNNPHLNNVQVYETKKFYSLLGDEKIENNGNNFNQMQDQKAQLRRKQQVISQIMKQHPIDDYFYASHIIDLNNNLIYFYLLHK